MLSMKLCCAKMVHRLGFRVSFQAVLDAREVLLELIYHTVCNKSAKVTARVDGGCRIQSIKSWQPKNVSLVLEIIHCSFKYSL